LPLVERQIAEAHRRRHVIEPDLRERFACATLGDTAVHETAACRHAAEEQILGHRHIVDERQFLIDDGDACIDGRVRAARKRHAVDLDRAFVRLVCAGQGLDQRRFARAVLADNRHHVPCVQREAHAAQRLHTGKALDDAFHMQQRRRAARAPFGAGGGLLLRTRSGIHE